MDRSGKVVNLTLWGSEAEAFDGSSCPVIALKGCKVSDFGGRSLSTQLSSLMNVDPDIPEAHQLRGWFDSVGRNKEVTSIFDQRSGGGGSYTNFRGFLLRTTHGHILENVTFQGVIGLWCLHMYVNNLQREQPLLYMAIPAERVYTK